MKYLSQLILKATKDIPSENFRILYLKYLLNLQTELDIRKKERELIGVLERIQPLEVIREAEEINCFYLRRIFSDAQGDGLFA